MEEKIRKSRERLSFFRGVLTAIAFLAIIYFASLVVPIGGYAKIPGTLQSLRKAKEIERVIQNYYLDEVNEQQQTEMMYVGQVAGLGDEYSTYYTKQQYEAVQRKQAGSFKGIGISIAKGGKDENDLVIVECLDQYPAALAGIMVDDVILKINGKSALGISVSDAVQWIQSSPDDQVSLTLSRAGEEFTVEIEMTELESTSVTGEILGDAVGYIRISNFTGVTASQFKTTYGELKIQGMEKLIIDLRDNPGGLVDSVCDTLNQILPEGVIVYTIDKNGTRKDRNSDGLSKIDIPLVVLVNEETASAAEIFAGAVKDYEIGKLIGVKTFGKGIVQEAFRLSDGSYVKLTVSKYYTPKGHNIHKVGIKPDITVKMTNEDRTDTQLDRALEEIAKMKSE